MNNDTLRAAITAALRRRGTIDGIDVTPSLTLLGSRTSTASVVIYGADGAVVDVVARAGDDAKALRGVASAVGLREDGSDPAEEVECYRTIAGNLLARIHRDGGHHADAIGWERAADEADMIVARLFVDRDEARAEVDRLRAGLALERERCAGLVREIPACHPGARATATRRWLDDRVADCVRAILRDDETATCARSLVREAQERAKAAGADLARMRAELAEARATIDRLLGVIGANLGEVTRLQFARESEAQRHEATKAAVREYLASVDALTIALADDSDAGNPVAMLARMHDVRTRRDETLTRLRALVSS